MTILDLKKKIDLFFEGLDPNKVMVVIAGPTGVGKSSFAVKLAKKLNGVIINADSVQVYEELEIVSGREKKIEDDVEHYLYGFRKIRDEFSVGHWLNCVKKTLSVVSDQKVPIFVGGSGLYIDAALNGIVPIPKIKKKIQLASSELIKKIGIEEFKKIVEKIDPIYVSKNHDRQRLLRLYNVYFSTGQNLTEWHKKEKVGNIKRKCFSILISSNRMKIYKNCDKRFDKMIELGALCEVKKIWKKKFDRSLSGLKSLGVKWLLKYFDNIITLEEAIYLSKKDTRHYVKRQITWFKKNYAPNVIINL